MRAAAYCRVSSAGEDQSNSFEAQKRFFLNFILMHPEYELYRIYADEGTSGTALEKRTEFMQMMSDARLGAFDVLITKEVSRFSRNILDTISCTRKLKTYGIAVIFMNDGINSLDADAELRLSIMASVAQEESRKTSERVKWGQLRSMEQGMVFGHSLLGYTVHNGAMIIEPFGAETVRKIFKNYAFGYSSGEIANLLNADKITTSTGKYWSAAAILKILKNEKYVGDLVQRKSYTPNYLDHKKKINHGQENLIYIKNHHEAIIDREQWELVQYEIESRRRKKCSSAVSEKHLFSGKIFCGCCGSVLVSRVRKNKDGSRCIRWTCSAALKSKEHCSFGSSIRDSEIRSMLLVVAEDINNILFSACSDTYNAPYQMTKPETSPSIVLAEQVQNKITKAIDLYLSGKITDTELEHLKQKYKSQLKALDNSVIAREKAETLTPDKKVQILRAGIMHAGTPAENFWRTLTERIIFYRDNHIEIKMKNMEWTYVFEKE